MNMYQNGSRLPVPQEVNSKYFFYQANPKKLNSSDISQVVDATKKFVYENGLHTASILLLSPPELESYGGLAAKVALENMVQALGFGDLISKVCILVCEWASIHIDDFYEGTSFGSIVLHTGPERYVLQMFHTEIEHTCRSKLRLHTETRVLSVGDSFVLDPTTPHMAVPESPNSESLLILLQFEFKDECPADRALIVKAMPPLNCDEDAVDIFNI